MKKRILLPVLGFFIWVILLACSCSLPSMIGIGDYKLPTPTLTDCGQTFNSDLEAHVVELINQARASHGLSPLITNELLTGAARRHSTDMACHDFVDSTGSDGASWHELMVEAGYLVKYGGIAAAGGYANDPAAVVQVWSQEEDGIVFDTNPTEIGVGVVTKDGTVYCVYWTVLYALPKR